MSSLAIVPDGFWQPDLRIVERERLPIVTEWVLRTFIGTSSPMQRLQVGDVVIPFPVAFPQEVDYIMGEYLANKNSARISHETTPKSKESDVSGLDYLSIGSRGLLPVSWRSEFWMTELAPNRFKDRYVGEHVKIPGLTQSGIVGRYRVVSGVRWYRVVYLVGSHKMVAWRQAHDLEVV